MLPENFTLQSYTRTLYKNTTRERHENISPEHYTRTLHENTTRELYTITLHENATRDHHTRTENLLITDIEQSEIQNEKQELGHNLEIVLNLEVASL